MPDEFKGGRLHCGCWILIRSLPVACFVPLSLSCVISSLCHLVKHKSSEADFIGISSDVFICVLGSKLKAWIGICFILIFSAIPFLAHLWKDTEIVIFQWNLMETSALCDITRGTDSRTFLETFWKVEQAKRVEKDGLFSFIGCSVFKTWVKCICIIWDL